MEILATTHIPVEQYGFIQMEYSFVENSEDEFHKKMISDYHTIKRMFKEYVRPKNPNLPTALGQTYEEFGRTYKSVQNEKTKEFSWLIDVDKLNKEE